MDWKTLTDNVLKLSSQITIKPDYIVGIARGGVVPALIIAHHLKVKNYFMIKIERVGDERKILADVKVDLTGKKVLIVEDMLETGKTMESAITYFKNLGAEVHTACLYVMNKTDIKIDYVLDTIDIIPQFPWEDVLTH
tara:strand:+ start:1331 stop:1744 length:414 start_codon:yes stop_codon:yes gene_type:complete